MIHFIHKFKNIIYNSVVTAVFVFAIWFLLGNPFPYWWIYITPFIVLIILLNNNSNVVLQLVSIVGELMLYIYQVRIFYWVFCPYNIINGILNSVIHVEGSYINAPVNMYNAFFSKMNINQGYTLEILCSLGFIFIGSFVLLCRKKRSMDNESVNTQTNIMFVYLLRIISIVITYLFAFLQLKYI